MKLLHRIPTALALILGLAFMGQASAAITRISQSEFLAAAGKITFSEYAQSTVNPIYTSATYGGGVGSPAVTFGGFFTGQSISLNATVDCPGAAASACMTGTPTGPLSLDPTSPNAFITSDASNPTSPVLSGNPQFNGPIAVLFDVDLAGVGFDAGYFDAANSTGITAFDRNGSLLGTVTNIGTGVEFLGLATSDGSGQIAGVFLDLQRNEPAGFAIDNLYFGRVGEVAVIPEPETYAMLLAGLGLLNLIARRRKTA